MRRHAVTLASATALIAVASASGGSGPGARLAILGVAFASVLASGILGRFAVAREAWPPIVATGVLATLALASSLWAADAAAAFDVGLRYAGYAIVLVLAAGLLRRRDASAVVDAIALSTVVVAALALGSEVAPGLLDSGALPRELPAVSSRLSYPVQYWNGLGLLLAAGMPALVAVGLRPVTPLLTRVAVGLGATVAVTAIALTSSRGAAASGALGVALVLLVDPRPRAWLRRRLRGRAVWALVAALAVAAAALVLVADPAARWDRFTAPPDATADAARPGFVTNHLLSGGGSGRWQFWSTALDGFRHEPLRGLGAGGFEAWWAAHGTLPDKVRSVHSLPLQTLAELGLFGALALLATVLATAAVVALRVRRESGARTDVAALAAVAVVVFAGSLVDWSSDLPAVAAPALLAIGALLAPAAAQRARRRATLPVVAVAAVLTAAALVPFLASRGVDASRDAVRRGDGVEALRQAAAARALQPWSSVPYVQEALVRERLADRDGAVRAIRAGIRRAPEDWRLELVAARLLVQAGDAPAAQRALARLRVLAPRYPTVAVATAP